MADQGHSIKCVAGLVVSCSCSDPAKRAAREAKRAQTRRHAKISGSQRLQAAQKKVKANA